jgi:hypothetical protein
MSQAQPSQAQPSSVQPEPEPRQSREVIKGGWEASGRKCLFEVL